MYARAVTRPYDAETFLYTYIGNIFFLKKQKNLPPSILISFVNKKAIGILKISTSSEDSNSSVDFGQIIYVQKI